MTTPSSNQASLLKNSQNNPKAKFSSKGKQTLMSGGKSHIISRLPKGVLENSICFISPKKIAFFQSIDENCLNETERAVLKRKGYNFQSNRANLRSKDGQNEIDYRSIKQCLSPRPTVTQKQCEQVVLETNSKPRQRLLPVKIQEYTEFKQKLIIDLKMQILQMGQLLQQKQRIIQQKDTKIKLLQRQLSKESTSEIIQGSFKSISTYMQQKMSSIIDPFSTFNTDETADRIVELQEKLLVYEHQVKKFQIETDILRKYRYDKQKMEAQLKTLVKKKQSMHRKMSRLTEKNGKLLQEINKLRHDDAQKFDRSIILQFSPEKHCIQS